MKQSLLKSRRLRTAASILIGLAALFILTGQYKRFSMSGKKELTVGVFSDNYWDVQNGYAYKILDDAVRIFEEDYPNIKVRYVSGIMKADYSEWLAEQMMNDAMPDVFFILGDDFDTFASIGALKNLDKFIQLDREFDPGSYYSAAYASGSYGNGQYALPFECAPTMMFVNKTILDRENVALPSKDWTWDDFYRICKAVTRDTDGRGVINQFGTVNYTWKDAFDANGVTLFDEEGRTCDFTVPQIEEAIAFLEKLEGLSSGYAVSDRNFEQGNVAFQPMRFSEYRAYKSRELSMKKYSGFEWECVTMPAGPAGDNCAVLDTLSIAMSEKTAMEDAAWEFMKLMTEDRRIQSEIFDYSAGISVLPRVTESEESLSRIQQSTGSAFNLSMLVSAMDKSLTEKKFRGYDSALDEAGFAVNSILGSRSSIQMEQIIWNRTINNFLKSLQTEE